MDPGLRRAVDLQREALAIYSTEQRRLAALLPHGELLLVGGVSVAGALTVGDVDLHLRVPAAEFAHSLAALKPVYPIRRPELWQETLATFAVPAALPAGLAVTPAGSEHDLRFTRTWRLLADDPDLVAAYNAMKLRYADGPAGAYEAAKSAFFDALLAAHPEA